MLFRLFIECVMVYLHCFFFFKQKTAYEMRISDWSSDVCSSDLIVLIAAVLIAFAANALSRVEAAGAIGGTIATIVSATFLFAIAAMNLIILRSVLKTFNHVRRGGAYVDEDMDMLLGSRGLLSRLFRPLFRLVTRSWHMAPDRKS